MPKRPEPVKWFVVRCLGPGVEHSFKSRNPRTNRICEDCRKRIRLVSPMVRDVVSPGRE